MTKGRYTTMKHKFRLRCAIAAVAAFTALGGASPAFALSSDTTGAEAYGNSNGDIKVYDTKCDGDPAYGRYILKGGSDIKRVNNKTGCNSTVSGWYSSAVTSVMACRDTTLAKDNCGGWNEW